jgi:hypothetical protein
MDKTNVFDPRWYGRSIPERHWHFHRQLLARYGIILAPGEFSKMLRDIRGGRALLIERRTRKTAIYSVKISREIEPNERIYVLSNGKDVFTAWPPKKRLNEIRRRMNRPEFTLRLRPVPENDI